MAIAVIGLGSNLQRPLIQLRAAFSLLARSSKLSIKAYSRIYQSKPLLPAAAPVSWADKIYLNAALRIETDLSPLDLLQLLKQAEAKLGRNSTERWAPRLIDLDLLAYDDLILASPTLSLPHPGLLERDFALIPLLEVWPEYQHPHFKELNLSTIKWDKPLVPLPHLLSGSRMMGILNITPDSFSDGGKYNGHDAAMLQAERLFSEGADIIDLGAESTRPGAVLIDIKTEWERLAPIVEGITALWARKEHRPLISVDTRHAAIIKRCLPYSIDWINDVSQAEFGAMLPLIKEHKLCYVAMHHLGVPPISGEFIKTDPMTAIRSFAQEWQERFYAEQIPLAQLILDPGIGFGKTPKQQVELIREFSQLKQSYEVEWLVGHSRKSLLKALLPYLDSSSKEVATALISEHLARAGVDYFRVHEPMINLTAITVSQLLSNTGSRF